MKFYFQSGCQDGNEYVRAGEQVFTKYKKTTITPVTAASFLRPLLHLIVTHPGPNTLLHVHPRALTALRHLIRELHDFLSTVTFVTGALKTYPDKLGGSLIAS